LEFNVKRTARIIAFILALSFSLVIGASAKTLGGAVITASNLNFRSSPSTDASILATITSGEEVVVLDTYDTGWCKVLVDGVEGYMYSTYLEMHEKLDFDVGHANVTGNGVRLRSADSWDSDTIGWLYSTDALAVTGVSGEWFKVDYAGNTGYVHSDYIKVSEENLELTRAVVTYTKGMEMADFAGKFLGTPYVYGGSAPGGFDCSGFTYYIYKQFGYTINRRASQQWYNGTQVSRENLQIGDLVFFSSSYSTSIEHVGMYVGNNQFIHSSSGGDCVKYNSLSDWYYDTHFYGAVRVDLG